MFETGAQLNFLRGLGIVGLKKAFGGSFSHHVVLPSEINLPSRPSSKTMFTKTKNKPGSAEQRIGDVRAHRIIIIVVAGFYDLERKPITWPRGADARFDP